MFESTHFSLSFFVLSFRIILFILIHSFLTAVLFAPG